MKSLKSLCIFLSMTTTLSLAFNSCSHPTVSNTFFVVESPKLVSIHIVDRNGLTETVNHPDRISQYEKTDFLSPQPYQKVLRVYARDACGNIASMITTYHPNGYPHKYLEIVNSRAFGAYKEWYPNGKQKLSANIIEGAADIYDGAELTWIFDGCSEVWDEKGNLKATIPYSKGLLEGTSTYYHPNGAIWKQVPFKQNQIDGTSQIYLKEGALLQISNYSKGILEGPSQRFWPNNVIAADEMYSDGLLTEGRYFDLCGNCIAEIHEGNGVRAIFGKDAITELHEYKYGYLDGEVKVFDKYGRVSKIYHVKNNGKHGEEITFWEGPKLQKTLNPKLSIQWYEGKIQGVIKTWYPNGYQESQKEMSNNKKNGHSTAWYEDGNLMMIEEYEQDHLVRGEYFPKGDRHPISYIHDGKGTATIFDAKGTVIKRIEYLNGKPLLEL